MRSTRRPSTRVVMTVLSALSVGAVLIPVTGAPAAAKSTTPIPACAGAKDLVNDVTQDVRNQPYLPARDGHMWANFSYTQHLRIWTVGANQYCVRKDVLPAASVVSSSGAASGGRTDPPGDQDANHCVNSFGVDYNDLYGVSEQFRTFECRVVSAGEHWVLLLTWITHDFSEDIYPPGYVPSRPEARDDFLAKFVALKVVVDGGTDQERTHVFDPAQIVRTDIHAEQVNPGAWGAPYPMASIMPTMPPVSIGQHTFGAILVLSAEHCDGFGSDPEVHCIPAGETSFGVRPLAITPPER